jgi:hypothetical protein
MAIPTLSNLQELFLGNFRGISTVSIAIINALDRAMIDSNYLDLSNMTYAGARYAGAQYAPDSIAFLM